MGEETIPTSASEFTWFVTCGKKWVARLGLYDWRIHYEHGGCDEDSYAEACWDQDGRVATIRLAVRWPKNMKTREEINRTALHEVLHLSFAALRDMAEGGTLPLLRSVVHREEAALVRRFENILMVDQTPEEPASEKEGGR